MTTVVISVKYTLREYLSIVQEHAPALLARQQPQQPVAARKPSAALRLLISVTATLSFLIKKRRMPVCEFVIDEHHIKRKTARGVLIVPWDEVLAVHRYSQGFLVEKKDAGVPLPYRCFSPDQSAAFAALVARRMQPPPRTPTE